MKLVFSLCATYFASPFSYFFLCSYNVSGDFVLLGIPPLTKVLGTYLVFIPGRPIKFPIKLKPFVFIKRERTELCWTAANEIAWPFYWPGQTKAAYEGTLSAHSKCITRNSLKSISVFLCIVPKQNNRYAVPKIDTFWNKSEKRDQGTWRAMIVGSRTGRKHPRKTLRLIQKACTILIVPERRNAFRAYSNRRHRWIIRAWVQKKRKVRGKSFENPSIKRA